MKRADGTPGTKPFTHEFQHTSCWATDPVHITADTATQAAQQVPWLEARYIGSRDDDGFWIH
jgi:hypothetical protein